MMRDDYGSIRLSSYEQKEEGKMLAFYKDSIMREGVKESNIIIEEGRSGSFSEDKDISVNIRDGKLVIEFDLQSKRPVFYDYIVNKVMKGKVRKHFVPTWSRLVRNNIVFEALHILFAGYGSELWAIKDTNDPSAKRIVAMLDFIRSEDDKKNVYNINRFKFDNGLYLGSTPPKGYDMIDVNINGKELKSIKKNGFLGIYDVFNTDLDYKTVCAKWGLSKGQYYSIRRNKLYAGYIRFQDEEKFVPEFSYVDLDHWKKFN